MRYNTLGGTGLQVSEICFGTMTFGAESDADESRAMFALCRDFGINSFDCANKYTDGEAERFLGTCIQSCRDQVIITSKAASRTGTGANDGGTSRKHLMLELEKSLQRLNTDYIDIYFIHYFDPHTHVCRVLEFLDDAKRQGKILFSGVSNWSAWQVMKALHLARINNLREIDCIQPMYSLVKRQAEVELLPLALDQDLGVLPYSPLGSGVLTGKYAEGIRPDKEDARLHTNVRYRNRYSRSGYFKTAQAFCNLATDLGVSPAALAVRWVMENPAVTAPILGARNCDQLKNALSAVEISFDKELYKQIESLSEAPSSATDRLEEATNAQKEPKNFSK